MERVTGKESHYLTQWLDSGKQVRGDR
jgi:hypothetical protein